MVRFKYIFAYTLLRGALVLFALAEIIPEELEQVMLLKEIKNASF